MSHNYIQDKRDKEWKEEIKRRAILKKGILNVLDDMKHEIAERIVSELFQ